MLLPGVREEDQLLLLTVDFDRAVRGHVLELNASSRGIQMGLEIGVARGRLWRPGGWFRGDLGDFPSCAQHRRAMAIRPSGLFDPGQRDAIAFVKPDDQRVAIELRGTSMSYGPSTIRSPLRHWLVGLGKAWSC